MSKASIALLLTVGLLGGCSGRVVVFGHTVREGSESVPKAETPVTAQQPAALTKTETPPKAEIKAPASAHIVNTVRLSLSPQAAAQIAADTRFKTDALLDAIRNELHERKLLDESSATGNADITIDHFAVEPASNAMVFGLIISHGLLSGDLRVSGYEGSDYHVDARTKLSIVAKEPEKASLESLYRRFAVLTADRLAGIEPESDLATDQSHR